MEYNNVKTSIFTKIQITSCFSIFISIQIHLAVAIHISHEICLKVLITCSMCSKNSSVVQIIKALCLQLGTSDRLIYRNKLDRSTLGGMICTHINLVFFFQVIVFREVGSRDGLKKEPHGHNAFGKRRVEEGQDNVKERKPLIPHTNFSPQLPERNLDLQSRKVRMCPQMLNVFYQTS